MWEGRHAAPLALRAVALDASSRAALSLLIAVVDWRACQETVISFGGHQSPLGKVRGPGGLNQKGGWTGSGRSLLRCEGRQLGALRSQHISPAQNPQASRRALRSCGTGPLPSASPWQ